MTRDVNADSPAIHARSRWFALAALAGGIHAGITLYWAIGGRALLWTMGDAFIAKFASVMWVLYPLAAVKAVGAFGPLWFQSHQWQPSRPLIRLGYWCASVVLLIWGGLNTVVSNLVLFGIVRPSAGYDRPVMIGHAWIWDPLFLVWGLGLLLGLTHTRAVSARRANILVPPI
ncbi:MAG: DUF3995 domain-containing protein [Luteococcus sp.]|uniref:DUF3995 domain-containing protein n=1 Tax=Luteococcus sp. TaxID=1969402 RepID=UPI0026493A01|nr:DUF3995 domain-containing protein [Luteococcus sp.]MDN5564774.1 DUF3995 domain-containing protein [Luteococcus sp.]